MPKAIPPGLTAIHVLRALADLDSGIEHPFGTPTLYELVHDGKRYPPKAVVGLAFKYLTGSALGPKDFAGGEAQGQANAILRGLDFDVVDKLSETDGPAGMELAKAAVKVNEEGYFSPATLQDERDRRLRQIVERRGQPEFRDKLIAAYYGKCAITGCDAVPSLEAAHLVPYCGPQSNHVSNGLLLRADIHTLFDLGLIGIEPETLAVKLAPILENSTYGDLQAKSVALPKDPAARPNAEAIAERWKRFLGG